MPATFHGITEGEIACCALMRAEIGSLHAFKTANALPADAPRDGQLLQTHFQYFRSRYGGRSMIIDSSRAGRRDRRTGTPRTLIDVMSQTLRIVHGDIIPLKQALHLVRIESQFLEVTDRSRETSMHLPDLLFEILTRVITALGFLLLFLLLRVRGLDVRDGAHGHECVVHFPLAQVQYTVLLSFTTIYTAPCLASLDLQRQDTNKRQGKKPVL